jgi:hypothetical protein
MPITTFRGETSVEEIADQLYRNLTSEQRDMVVRTMLKANPKLRHLERLKVGSVINVPDSAALKPRLSRASHRIDQPDVRIAEQVEDALLAFRDRHRRHTQQALQDNRRQQALLEDAGFRKTLGDDTALTELAGQAAKAGQARDRRLEKGSKDLDDAVRQMLKDLDQGLS